MSSRKGHHPHKLIVISSPRHWSEHGAWHNAAGGGSVLVAAGGSNQVAATGYRYPPAALQQFARNAIMHRAYEGNNAPVRIYWFDDRIEFINPGGPYGAI